MNMSKRKRLLKRTIVPDTTSSVTGILNCLSTGVTISHSRPKTRFCMLLSKHTPSVIWWAHIAERMKNRPYTNTGGSLQNRINMYEPMRNPHTQ